MAAQSIREAVKIGCKDLLADQDYLLSELRDYEAHEMMRYEADMAKSCLLSSEEQELIMDGLRAYFERVYKDINCSLRDSNEYLKGSTNGKRKSTS